MSLLQLTHKDGEPLLLNTDNIIMVYKGAGKLGTLIEFNVAEDEAVRFLCVDQTLEEVAEAWAEVE